MKVIKHKTTNSLIRPPDTLPAVLKADGRVVACPMTRAVEQGLDALHTYWQPSEEDIANVLAGGVIKLTVYGVKHHPVLSMKVEMP